MNVHKVLLSVVIFFIAGAMELSARDIYVDLTYGDVANSGSSWSQAKRLINEALPLITGPGYDTIHVAAGSYEESVTINIEVTLLGGYPAGGGVRDPGTNETIIDPHFNVNAVQFNTGGVLDGFTITGVYYQVTGTVDFFGGAIKIIDSSPIISNNVIKNNTTMGPWGDTFGYPICACYAGGIYCLNSGAVITGNQIYFNNAYGGVIEGSTVHEAKTGYGGGICCINSTCTISGNIIASNEADTRGSTAPAYGYGGGIYVLNGACTITRNKISGNTAVSAGGGIYVEASPDTLITNNFILINHSLSAVELQTKGKLINNTIQSNDYFGLVASTGTEIINNIFLENGNVGIRESGEPSAVMNNVFYNNADPYRSLSTTYHDVASLNAGLSYASGNLSCSPDLITFGDCHVLHTSCCIDAGVSTSAPSEDFDGDPRPFGAGYDIGCDEYGSTSVPAISITFIVLACLFLSTTYLVFIN